MRREVGARLAQVRKAAGFSQIEMASALDVTLRSYQAYEQGTREIPTALYRLIRQRFQVDLAWLMEGQGSNLPIRSDPIDKGIWFSAFVAVEKALADSGLKIEHEKKFALIQLVYEELLTRGDISDEKVKSFARLAA